MAVGVFVGGALLAMLGVGVMGAVLGLHGLLLGRLPGRWLQRHVHRPRVWGTGALLVVASWGSPFLCVVGLGLVAVGHVAAPVS